MSVAGSICVNFSIDKHMDKMLEAVRKKYPEARLVVVIPRGHVLREAERALADEFIESQFSAPCLLRPWAFAGFILGLRRRRFDLAIVQFESIKVRLFAVLTKPGECVAWLPTGQNHALTTSFFRMCFDFWRVRAWGYGKVLMAWLHAYLVHIRPEVKVKPRK